MTFEKYQDVCNYLTSCEDRIEWALAGLDKEQLEYFKAKFEIDLAKLYDYYEGKVKSDNS